jgi:phage antirepressor YoqD-like protein
MQEDSNFAEELLDRLAAEHAKNSALMEYVDTLQPKAQYYDAVLQSDRAIPATLIAKDYGLTTIAFNKLLHALGVQYRIGPQWFLYKEYAGRGYTVTKTYFVDKKQVSIHTAWTMKGRAFLYDLLAWYGILPEAERQIGA